MFEIPIKEPILITANKKIEGNHKKWQKLPSISNIEANFYNKNFQKYIKIYINRKTILSAFQCFLFHKKNYIYFLSYCIISATIYELSEHFQSICASFSPDIQPNIIFFTEIIAIGSDSPKKQ